MALPTQQSPGDSAEDFWLAWHDVWLQPLAWLTEWWNAYAVPAGGHYTWHAPASGAARPFDVPEPIAHATEQDLFA